MKFKVLGISLILILAMITTASADDGRFCFGPGQVQAALYASEDGGLDIYAIDSNGQGFVVGQFSADELAEIEESSEEALTLFSSTATENGVIDIAMYKLPSNEWQVNAGPNYDAEVFACIFNDVPDFDVRIDTFHLK